MCLWKATVYEDAMNQIRTDVHPSQSAAPTREADALDVAEALDLDHPTKLAGATIVAPTGGVSRSIICGSVYRGVRCGKAPGLTVGRSILLYRTRHAHDRSIEAKAWRGSGEAVV